MARDNTSTLPPSTSDGVATTGNDREEPDGASTAVHASDDAGADVLDVPAVARLLAVGRNTVYALVARNAIPHRRLGKQIRFQRAAVMRWLGSWSSQGAKEGH
ncbi:MAG: helix-turn-helix domain-containing protein [Kofleriaceae bacterium]